MKKDIYNKNAREAHLMAEAYNNIYNEDKDFDDEQKDQDPHRHKGLSDFDAEQRDQDPHRHDEDGEGKIFGLVDKDGKIVSLYDNEGVMRQVMASSPDLKAVPLDELPFNTDVSSEDGEHTEYDSEADAYRAMSDGYKAEDSVKVGNIYKGESYYELVVGIKGDNVFTKRIDLEDGNQYDINQMHKELSHAGNIDFEVLNEIM